MNKTVYPEYSEEKLKQAYEFCDGYKNFITTCKTERETIIETVKLAKENGFKDIKDCTSLKAGDKVYSVNMEKCIALAVVGSDDITSGLNVLGAHVDSPRLDLKATPVYEDSSLCYLDTHYYGGIKKYQWTTTPLAIHGIVVKKDGTKINLSIGENETDPVFSITELLPHLDKVGRKEIVTGEELNILVGTVPLKDAKSSPVKANIIKILQEKGIEEDDLFSAEIEIVPAGKARDCGLDSSMVIGYGQDDRVCAYPSLVALFNTPNPTKTCVCLMVDKEEIGSVGATSMGSRFFENFVAEIVSLTGEYSDIKVRRCLSNSNMLSSDVTAGFDPARCDAFNKNTEAFLCHGVSFNKYTGSRGKYDANDTNAEYIAKLRNVLDENGVLYQATEMGKVDVGGGGTIAYIMAKYCMNVIDAGVPVLSMHAPWEITAKVDIYEAYLCYLNFLKFM